MRQLLMLLSTSLIALALPAHAQAPTEKTIAVNQAMKNSPPFEDKTSIVTSNALQVRALRDITFSTAKFGAQPEPDGLRERIGNLAAYEALARLNRAPEALDGPRSVLSERLSVSRRRG